MSSYIVIFFTLAVSGLNFLYSMLNTRFLGLSDIGIYSLLVQSINTVVLISDFVSLGVSLSALISSLIEAAIHELADIGDNSNLVSTAAVSASGQSEHGEQRNQNDKRLFHPFSLLGYEMKNRGNKH